MHATTLLSFALAGRLALASPAPVSSIFGRQISPNNSCGKENNGYKCPSDPSLRLMCCSGYGWCGFGDLYCGKDCQPEYGECGREPANPGDVGTGPTGPSLNGRCGPEYNKTFCAADECCSETGWCGKTKDHCKAPDCKMDFGPACDANKKPSGEETASIDRSALGSVLIGGIGIHRCEHPGTVALTFDDGPGPYTADLLDLLKAYGIKATFFITGNNNGKGAIDVTAPFPEIIKRMYAEGHQIASHTWSHARLTTLTSEQRKNEMVRNEMALRNILGFIPTYMRPPYSDCTGDCPTDMSNLGYHVIYFDLDTSDYLNVTPETIHNSKDIFDKFWEGKDPTKSDALAISHDIIFQTVHNLTDHMGLSLLRQGYRGVTVGECLNDPETNWYRDSTGKGVRPPHR